jgi:hypothetical protein
MRDRRGRRATIAACALLLALLSSAPHVAQESPGDAASGPALGYVVDPSVVPRLPESPPDAPLPLTVRLTAQWPEVEREAGVYDWSRYGGAIAALVESGHRVVLCLTGTHPLYLPAGGPPSPFEGDSLQAWVGFARSAVREFGGRVELFEIWDWVGPADRTRLEPTTYAFLLKNSAVAMRAEARAAGVSIGVAQASLAPTSTSCRWRCGRTRTRRGSERSCARSSVRTCFILRQPRYGPTWTPRPERIYGTEPASRWPHCPPA